MRSLYALLAVSLLVNPNSVECERERLTRMALGTLRAINALLGHALAWRRRRTVNLCDHCDPWVQVSGKSSEALARVDISEDSEEDAPLGQPAGG